MGGGRPRLFRASLALARPPAARPLAASVGGGSEKYGVYPNAGGHLTVIAELVGSVFFYLGGVSFSGCVYYELFYY